VLAERHAHVLDWRGAGLLGGATGALLVGLVWAGHAYGWGSLHVLIPFAAAFVLGAGFVLAEQRAPEPLLPLAFLRAGPVAAGLVCIGLSGFVMFGAIAYLEPLQPNL
jgi:hypothetical protein